MAKGDEITTKFKVDISDLKKGIADANQEIKLANAEFKAATAGMDDWSKSADGISAKLQQLDSVLSAQKSKLASYTEELKRQQQAYEENGSRIEQLKAKLAELATNGVSKASDEYKKYETALAACEKEQDRNSTAIDKLKVTVLNQQAAVNQTEADIRKYGTALEETGTSAEQLDQQLDDLNSSAKESGDGFTVMKGALADLVSAGIQAAIQGLKDLANAVIEAQQEYDSGADAIIAATGATGEAAQELITVYENVSGSVIGSFDEIGTAVGEVNTRFGLTGDELQKVTEQFLKFAQLNGTDVKTSIDNVQSAMAAFGVGTEQTSAMLDLLNKAGQDTGVSVEQLAQQLVANATALQEMGMSVSDSTMFLATLSKNGIEASTVMAGMKKAIANAAAEGKPMSQAMDEIEKSIKNAKTSTDAIQIAIDLFGAKAGPAIAMAVREGRLSFEDFGLTLKDFQGNIETTYDSMMDGPDKITLALQNLKLEAAKVFDSFLQEHGPQIEKLIETFTNTVLPALKTALGAVLDAIGSIVEKGAEFIEWITSGSADAEAFKAVVLALVTAFGAFAAALAVHTLIQKVQAAMTMLNAVMAANPIALVVTAIAALVAAFVTLWNKSEEFRNFWIGLWEAVKGAVEPVIKAIVEWFTKAWEDIKQAWSAVGEFFTGIWEAVKTVFDPVVDFFTEKFTSAKTGIQDSWETVKDWFAEKWEGIKSVFEPAGEWFKEKFTTARDWVNQAWQDVGTWFGERRTDIETAMSTVNTWFQEKFAEARKWTEQAFADVGNWFGERRKDVENAWQSVDNWMGDKFGSAWEAIKNAFKPFVDYFRKLWENVKDIYSAVESVFKGDFEAAWNAIKSIWDRVTGYFRDIWEGIKSIFAPVAEWFGGVFNKVGTAIKAPLNAVIRAMNTVIRGLNKIKIDIPDWVPGLGNKQFGFNIGEIPELAEGGVLQKGQMGLLEGRGAEAVVPLDKNKAWIREVANDLLDALGSGAGGGVAGSISKNRQMNFTQNIYAPKQPSRIELYRQTRNLLAYASARG